MEQPDKIEDEKPEVAEVTVGLSAKVTYFLFRKLRSLLDQSFKLTHTNIIPLMYLRSLGSKEHSVQSVKLSIGERVSSEIHVETQSVSENILSLEKVQELD